MFNIYKRPLAFAGILLYLLGILFQHPFLPFSSGLDLKHFFSLLCFFLSFCFALWGFGQFINQIYLKNKKLHFIWSITLGLVVTSFIAYFVYLLPFTAMNKSQTLKSVVMIGLLLSSFYQNSQITWTKNFKIKYNSSQIFLAFLFIYLLLAFLVVCIPHVFWDSMWYHLAAPRHWFMQGKIQLSSQNIIEFQASYVELLFLYANALLSTPVQIGQNLLQVQIFAQWLNFLVGVLLSLWACFLIFGKYFLLTNKKGKFKISSWFFLALFFLLWDFPLHYSSLSAKNDWIIVLCALGGWFFICEKSVRAKNLGLILLGFCVGAKWSYAFFALTILFLERKNFYYLKKTHILFFLFPILPIMIRNFYFSHNPFLPTFSSWFSPDFLGPSWKHGMAQVEGSFKSNFSFHNIWRKSRLLFWPKPFLLLSLIYPWYKNKLKGDDLKFFNKIFFVALGGIVFIIFKTGPQAEFRLLAICFIFLTFISFWVLAQIIDESKYTAGPAFFIFIFMLCSSRIFSIPTLEFKSIWRFYTEKSWTLSQHLNAIPGIGLTSWAYKNLPANQIHKNPRKLFLLSDPKLYYLIDNDVSRLWDNAQLDNELHQKQSAREVLLLLAEKGRYLADSIHDIDSFSPTPLVRAIINELKKYPTSVVFQSKGEWVVDLEKLQLLMGSL